MVVGWEETPVIKFLDRDQPALAGQWKVESPLGALMSPSAWKKKADGDISAPSKTHRGFSEFQIE